MTLFLTILFYIIPILICWVFIYNFARDNDEGRTDFDRILFTVFLILSILPILNVIFAFIISVIFIIRNPKKKHENKYS